MDQKETSSPSGASGEGAGAADAARARNLLGRALHALDPRRLRRLREAMNRLRVDLQHLSEELDRTRGEMLRDGKRLSGSIAWLAARHAADLTRLEPLADGPLVSVVMPVWNREGMVGAAIDSIRAQRYANWELVVVDDGSTDGSAEIVAGHLDDARIRLVRAPHEGVGAARNRALADIRGEIVAYLDSDNEWYPHHLQEAVRALLDEPARQSVYLGQLVRDTRSATAYIRGDGFDPARLAVENYIDLNVFAHRRALYDRHGGFDEALTRGEDWDLILRYTADAPSRHLPFIGGIYETSSPGRLLDRMAVEPNLYRIWTKHGRRLTQDLKVLYLLGGDARLADAELLGEIECMRRWGVEVEAWRQDGDGSGPAIAPAVPLRRGPLADVLGAVQPDIVQAFGSGVADAQRIVVADAGLPMTVREPWKEPSAEAVAGLLAVPSMRAIFLPPEQAGRFAGSDRVHAIGMAFNGELFHPSREKDRRLVFGAAPPGAGAEALAAFERVAASCPDHRFVLALAEGRADDAAAVGDRVDVRCGLSRSQVAALMRVAGLYLTLGAPRGPRAAADVVQAMASGCHVLAPRDGPAPAVLGGAGRLFAGEAEAGSLIAQTAGWDDAAWERDAQAAVERAYRTYADTVVYRTILDCWLLALERDPATAFRGGGTTPGAAETTGPLPGAVPAANIASAAKNDGRSPRRS